MQMDIANLVWLDATELARLIAGGEVTAVEVVQAHLDRIEAVGERVNAFVTVLAEQALEAASRSRSGPLASVPFTVKDSFDTAGARTTRGSLLFVDHVPGTDATAVSRLRDAGGIVLGKTNLPEMSYWTETDNRVAGRSLNPYDAERTPGGSSGGESAAIAAGLSPLGLGSDVAISVRGPAHDTGIASIKPTHGRVPYTGHFPDCLRRWWHVGPMARSVRDLRLTLRLLEGPDGRDPYAVALPRAISGRLTPHRLDQHGVRPGYLEALRVQISAAADLAVGRPAGRRGEHVGMGGPAGVGQDDTTAAAARLGHRGFLPQARQCRRVPALVQSRNTLSQPPRRHRLRRPVPPDSRSRASAYTAASSPDSSSVLPANMTFVQPSRSVRRQPETFTRSSASSASVTWCSPPTLCASPRHSASMTWCSPPTLCASPRHSAVDAVSGKFSQPSAATNGSRRTV